jgi:hypothetical protein
MIIEFNKKSNFYDNLVSELYGCEINNTIYNNFIPIKLLDEYYILTSSKNLEGYLIDYRDGIKIKLYIENNDSIECEEIILTNIVIFGKNTRETVTNCYIDIFNNLLLIKFNSSKLNYIHIDDELSLDLDLDLDLRFDVEKIKLKYIWIDEKFNTHTLNKFSKIVNTWNDKYINLPPIPYMIDIIEDINSQSEDKDIKNQTYPITGSGVYDSNNNFMGMVSYLNSGQIIITPLVCIKKMKDYLRGENILYMGLDLYPIKLDFKLGLNDINYHNGLLVTNNYYDNIIHKKNNLERKIKKIIDNDEEIVESNKIVSGEIIDYEFIIESDKKIKDNKILNNLIEKKKIFDCIDIDKNFKKGNIICGVDNFKINSNGFLIINTKINQNNKLIYKTIPFKSYIWLFKNNYNKRIVLNNILPNNYMGDLTKQISKSNEIIIDDSHIKKKINLCETNIILETEFERISSIGFGELKYITYNSIKVVEITEKIMEILKDYMAINQSVYSSIFNKIFNSKYTYNDKKILFVLNFETDKKIIKILPNNIKNFEYLLNKYKTKNEQKNFLLGIS